MIVRVPLTEEETEKLHASANALKDVIAQIDFVNVRSCVKRKKQPQANLKQREKDKNGYYSGNYQRIER